MAKLLVLDGNSLAYRAFFALPTDLATAAGQVTNAVLGFTQMLTYTVKEQRPDGVIVAFDRPEPTFRHGMVDAYKAGREAAPDILKQQMGLVRQVLEALRVPTIEVVGFEADDILATLACQARDRGDEVIIVTGDRDSYQLVEDPYIRVLYNKRGVSDYALYDEAGIKERTGVTPELYPQYAALRGDPSDNLPGVPGVGEKTAAKLINEYGGLDGIFENLDKLTPKLRENLTAAQDAVRANAEVIPLIRDMELPELDPDAVQWGGWDEQEVRDLFAFLEFRGPIERLIEAFGADGRGGAAAAAPKSVTPTGDAISVDVDVAADAAAVAALAQALAASVAVVGAWEGRAGRSPLTGLALCAPGAPHRSRRRSTNCSTPTVPLPRTTVKRCCARCCHWASTCAASRSTSRLRPIWSIRRRAPMTSTSWCCAIWASRSTPRRRLRHRANSCSKPPPPSCTTLPANAQWRWPD